jgi:hypothetical protein
MITKLLKQLVVEEATKLKQYATDKELVKLEFSTLDPSFPNTCIYGQMTGNCFSERSKDLLLLCAKPYRRMGINNGKTRATSFKTRYVGSTFNPFKVPNREIIYSPIECFISEDEKVCGQGREKLIDFLQNKTQTLEL